MKFINSTFFAILFSAMILTSCGEDTHLVNPEMVNLPYRTVTDQGKASIITVFKYDETKRINEMIKSYATDLASTTFINYFYITYGSDNKISAVKKKTLDAYSAVVSENDVNFTHSDSKITFTEAGKDYIVDLDAMGRATKVSENNVVVETFEYDATSRLAKRTLKKNDQTESYTYSYDSMVGYMKATKAPSWFQYVVTKEYNGFGNNITKITRTGGSINSETNYAYQYNSQKCPVYADITETGTSTPTYRMKVEYVGSGK